MVTSPRAVRLAHTGELEPAVFVLPGPAPLDVHGELTCDWRDEDVW